MSFSPEFSPLATFTGPSADLQDFARLAWFIQEKGKRIGHAEFEDGSTLSVFSSLDLQASGVFYARGTFTTGTLWLDRACAEDEGRHLADLHGVRTPVVSLSGCLYSSTASVGDALLDRLSL